MGLPEIVIDLEKIKSNVRTVRALADPLGIEVVGVTKGVLGDVRIAEAFLAGGITTLGDSRWENLQRLRQAFPDVSLMLLRIPGLSQIERVIRWADISLNSDLEVLQALSEEALRCNKQHKVILMVDLGDLREGVWPQDLPELTKRARLLPGIRIIGLGANFACYGGLIPTVEKVKQLVELADAMEGILGYSLAVISGGNSANLPLVLNQTIPQRINQLRLGEGILQGTESIQRRLLPGSVPDAFVLRAEIIERYEKPTLPLGETGQDAFGKLPKFTDEGWRKRGILALGRQDVPLEGLMLRDQRLRIFGASSDHLIVDLTEAGELALGSIVEFNLSYGGLLGAMTSPYVEKRYV
ncbi:Alanine racemase [Acididesulfobacillus acetoxydans]|uniref:Alanine racemase n=1 Tax=Acididesulfobacillus acetoxydans TaxID=1561005 RepID=A0A8S0X205_9FIRM|nr:alanine/ornithine racemase family PLP-dependent enzyme [Acididesulfobacillus acetoxydans]CAA7603361.1 Alanine racemase [Acididesulfobacillus acetoxydans]CEJ09310.1 Alanine racemase domain protein [Acididesulfobacillus acetoxydans]